MRIQGHDIDILVTGFPGKSVCHGSLGWSTIALVRSGDRTALIDAGAFGMRRLLLDRLAERGMRPADVGDLLLTHSHHDHAINWTLFAHARIVIAGAELDWAVRQPWGETAVPELYMRELQGWPTAHRAVDGEEVFPGITAHVTPGHTPGHLVYVLAGTDHDVIFTGDAAKNRAELLSRRADGTYDPAISTASIEGIWERWRRRPGTVLVPGHDVPMVLDGDRPRYLADRQAAIRAWFAHDLDSMTLIQLAVA
ncbi:MAG: MBL fold metallo-hydrolase [Alphaproteobacteria bacterium]|nr:MBL fold metallo-hydrolase [Alphaproteobacteria bacterium]